MRFAELYVPTKNTKEEYLPYFNYEEDKEIEGYGYLIKEVKLKSNSELDETIIKGIEALYNEFNSEYRRGMEEAYGLEFEYRLNVDQTNSYYLAINEKSKEFISSAVLNIAITEEGLQEMILVTSDGACYGNAEIIDLVDDEGKAFIKTLVNKKLLKRKRERVDKK